MDKPRHNHVIVVVLGCDNEVSYGRLDNSSKNKFDLVHGIQSDEHATAPRVEVRGVENMRNQGNCLILIGMLI